MSLSLETLAVAGYRMGNRSPRFVRREIDAGRLGPLVKIGPKASGVPSDAVDKWITDRIAEALGRTPEARTAGSASTAVL